MLVPVKRVCTFLIVACLGACIAQGAGATDLKFYPDTPPQPNRPDWAGFYFRANPGGGSDSIPWTTPGTPNGFSSPGAATRPVNDNFGYNFQSGNFVFGLEGSLAAANFDAQHELARHSDGSGRIFIWSMASLCQRRVRRSRRRVAAARRPDRSIFAEVGT